MTREEKHIWYDFLKKLPCGVNRQKQLEGFIVDFMIPEARIVIEIDGSQHYSEEGRARDAERDGRLNEMGFSVLRYSNDDINRTFEGVCIDIMIHLQEKGLDVSWEKIRA
ncbi:MAG: endonuclease domain-containing protein [Clostridiales bacterium]|nr:endonuclease domain-containing protein [Clostridiales bacterium]